MNLALDRLADNPIIDELVYWPPKRRRIKRVRACSVLFRRPFIEVEYDGGEILQRHFTRDNFAHIWAEARVILETLTTIELVSEFSHGPVPEPEALVQRVRAIRDECIAEVEPMFEQGLYEQYLMQFGEDCRELPSTTQRHIDFARARLDDSA